MLTTYWYGRTTYSLKIRCAYQWKGLYKFAVANIQNINLKNLTIETNHPIKLLRTKKRFVREHDIHAERGYARPFRT